MGRPYKGFDYEKITVKLDAELSEIVRQYGHDTLERNPAQKRARPSDTIRDAIALIGRYMELSDIIETSICNLLDVEKIFDKIDGPTAQIYAEAIREAAVLLLLFCYNERDEIIKVMVEDGSKITGEGPRRGVL